MLSLYWLSNLWCPECHENLSIYYKHGDIWWHVMMWSIWFGEVDLQFLDWRCFGSTRDVPRFYQFRLKGPFIHYRRGDGLKMGGLQKICRHVWKWVSIHLITWRDKWKVPPEWRLNIIVQGLCCTQTWIHLYGFIHKSCTLLSSENWILQTNCRHE